MRSHNRQGAQHRNGHRSRLIFDGCVENGGLVEYFFGKDGNAGLQLEKFIQFMKDLQIEVTVCYQANFFLSMTQSKLTCCEKQRFVASFQNCLIMKQFGKCSLAFYLNPELQNIHLCCRC